MSLRHKVLVLNKHGIPFDIFSVEHAIMSVITSRAVFVSEDFNYMDWDEWVLLYGYDLDTLIDDDECIHTPSYKIKRPQVIQLKTYSVYRAFRIGDFSRMNVFKTYNFTCQYCGRKFDRKNLTYDHVIPRSKGGPSSWQNIVPCCKTCNSRKGNKMLDDISMKLLTKPKAPQWHEIYREEFEKNPMWKNYISVH